MHKIFYSILLISIVILSACTINTPSNSTTNNEMYTNASDSTLKQNNLAILNCSDYTISEHCSTNKPLYCHNGILINDSPKCGCPEGFSEKDEGCIVDKTINPIIHTLTFCRQLQIGRREQTNFTTYKNVNDYLSTLDRDILYYPTIQSEPTDKDFVLKNIDNVAQDQLLQPLVEQIKQMSTDKNEQARIAISIVQMIPYDTTKFESKNTTRKYAYEVLHTFTGVCDEKSELMIYLLKHLGFGTAYFVFGNEHHATAAIKCPVDYSYMSSGYCFIEATDVALIGQSNDDYVDVGKLSYHPKIYEISAGLEYTDIITQIEDAKAELKNGTRFQIKDRSGSIILRKSGDYYETVNYPDVIIKYPD